MSAFPEPPKSPYELDNIRPRGERARLIRSAGVAALRGICEARVACVRMTDHVGVSTQETELANMLDVIGVVVDQVFCNRMREVADGQ